MMVIVLLTLPRLKPIIPPQLPSTGLWTPKVVFGHTQLASKDQSHDLFSQPTVWNLHVIYGSCFQEMFSGYALRDLHKSEFL